MADNDLWIIYVLAFGAVLLGVQSAYWFLSQGRREKKAINRRLALSQTLGTPTEVLDTLRRERGLGMSGNLPVLAAFEELFLQTGLRIAPTQLLLMALAIAAAIFFL